jgi:hypothetical protein
MYRLQYQPGGKGPNYGRQPNTFGEISEKQTETNCQDKFHADAGVDLRKKLPQCDG